MSFENDLQRGRRGEEHFRTIDAHTIFGAVAPYIKDETNLKREGEMRLPDGQLIEIKTDYRCYRKNNPTKNLPIEIKHEGHRDGKGWYYHCKENGVQHLVFLCYRSEKKRLPFMLVHIPFPRLVEFVESDSNHWSIKSTCDRKGGKYDVSFYCAPLAELMRYCDASCYLSKHYTQIPEFEKIKAFVQDEWEYLAEVYGLTGLMLGEDKEIEFQEIIGPENLP